MQYGEMIQSILDRIDERIQEPFRLEELAREAGYSTYHFCRIFQEETGIPVMHYIIRRKLEYALYDLSRGRKVLYVALEYGFQTHAGFTRAFKRYFGYPPSLYRLHLSVTPPGRPTLYNLQSRRGESKMQVKIKEIQPFHVVGYASRHRIPGVSGISNIPIFADEAHLDYVASLSTLHWTYVRSHHCEVSVCFDVDEENDCFTYMLGVGVDKEDYDVPLRPGTYLYEQEGGLYAVFTTPLVEEEQYFQSIRDTWKKILSQWLPESEYEFDSGRNEFEYYDERDHAWLHDGKSQMDIYIPIRKKEL